MVVAAVLGPAGCSFEGDGSAVEPTDAAAGSPPAASGSAPSSAPPPASPAPSPVPVTGPDQKLVTMEVTGGFAGVHQEVTLRGDGTIHTADKGERTVRRTDTAQFTELRTLLGDPALDDVADLTKNTEAADLFQYTLRFDGRTVMTDRSTDEPALGRLIDALRAWLPK